MTSFVLIFVLLISGATDVSVETLDGQKLSGSLVALDDQSVTLTRNGRNQTLAIADVARIVSNSEAASKLARASVWLELADDTRLTATTYLVKGDFAEVQLTTGQTLRIARRQIRHVRFKSQDTAIAQQWKKILATNATADLLVVRKQDKIDFLEGVVEDVDVSNVHFKFDDDVIPVKLEKVEGIVYHDRAREKVPEAKAAIETFDDAHVLAVRWKLDEKGNLTVTTPLALAINLPLSAISRADLTAGKLAYLSDMHPILSKWTPYIGGGDELPLLEMMFRPRSDQAMDGEPLRLGGKEYRKGLSIHSRTELSYDLKAKYRRFKTLAGIDDRMHNRGNVEVTIKTDGKVLFTGEFTGKDEPLPLDLDVTGARRLEILVDYGKDLDIADHLDFIDARVIK